jgi:hypothetical protein
MPAITKRDRPFRIEFVSNKSASPLGGLPAIEALAQQFGLWQKVKGMAGLDRRVRKSRGYGPEVMLSQLIYAFVSGGDSLADCEKLNDDPLAKRLAGVTRFADETTVGEWLRGQNPESLKALLQLNVDFVQWVSAQLPAARWQHLGQREVFFDDTELEVSGKNFEGARLNYDNKMALCWQVLWVGPFLAGQHLGGQGEVSSELDRLLSFSAPLWQKHSAYFYADSASAAGKYLERIGAESWQWSVSYNKWTGPLERAAESLPASQWSPLVEQTWKNGKVMHEQFAWIKHQPEGVAQPVLFALARRREANEMFWKYAFIACESERSGTPQRVFERHHLKGEREQLFSEVLTGLDLHHPPCSELSANQIYYAVAALAYNLLIALKLLHLPDERLRCKFKTLIREIMVLPGQFISHARRLTARIFVAPQWLNWWRIIYQKLRTHPTG